MVNKEHIQRDAAILERIAANDSTALVELYDRHATALFSILMRTLKEKAEAENVLQELFVSLWKNDEPYDLRLENPAAWLCRLARNKAVERLRIKDPLHPTKDQAIENFPEMFAADFAQSSEHKPYLSGQQEEILIALTSLSNEQKTIIELAYFRGFNYTELAGYLKITPEALRTRIRSAVAILRQKLRRHLA